MTEHEASRTLVKSPPELWAELSDESSLGRHLDQFGGIRITRLEPESAVAWEGERVSGTVRLEPSGWGTKVILTARAQGVPAAEARVDEEPEAEVVADEVSEAEAEPAHEAPAPPESLPRHAPDPEPLHPAAASTPALAASRATQGFFGRLFGFFGGPRPEPAVAVEPSAEAFEPPTPAEVAAPVEAVDPVAPVAPEGPERAESNPETTAEATIDAAGVLAAALDRLGQAHHRPFSRG